MNLHRPATVTALAIAFALVLTAGCGYPGAFQDTDRARELMQMASRECQLIEDGKSRLTHQLNIADMQMHQSHRSDARVTLTQAQETLEQMGADLDADTRMAGWVSISELYRRAKSPQISAKACNEAKEILTTEVPVPDRCKYVRELASELDEVFSKDEAAKLLRQASAWLPAMTDADERHTAAVAIAADLFQYDDYEGGKAIIDAEGDVEWRVKTLTQLARRAIPHKTMSWGSKLNYQERFLDPDLQSQSQ